MTNTTRERIKSVEHVNAQGPVSENGLVDPHGKREKRAEGAAWKVDVYLLLIDWTTPPLRECTVDMCHGVTYLRSDVC